MEILSGIFDIIIGFLNIIFQFITTLLDNVIFDYLPDVSLIIGYISVFLQLIFQHLDWILNATLLPIEFYAILFLLYFLRYSLIGIALSFHLFITYWNIYKGGS